MPTPGDYEFVEKALKRRIELEIEIERINMSLALFESVMGFEPGELSNGRPPIRGTVPLTAPIPFEGMDAPPPDVPARSAPKSRRSSVSQEEFNELAPTLLKGHGSPLQSLELLKMFSDLGRPIGGTDELGNLTTKLWRAGKAGKVTKLKDGRYWATGVPWPPYSEQPPSGDDAAKSAEGPSSAT